MKFFAQSFLKKLATLVAVLCFSVVGISAQEVGTQLTSNSTQLDVGQTVLVNLTIQPENDTPIYTVSANLVYEPEKLEFVSAVMEPEWFELNQKDVFVTDMSNGLIIRTAGYPNGFLGKAKFITYKFKAKQSGDTRILIAAGQAYNDSNANLGIRNTDLSIKIRGSETQTEVSAPEKVLEVGLKIKGNNAFYRQEPYTFTIYHKKEDKHQQAITKMWLFDEDWNVKYEQEKLWRTDQDNILDFVIPENTVDKEGNYKIIAKVRYEDGREFEVSEKDLGVLSNGKTWFTKNSQVFMPLFWVVVLLAVIHHFFSEREIYFKIRKYLQKDKSRKKR